MKKICFFVLISLSLFSLSGCGGGGSASSGDGNAHPVPKEVLQTITLSSPVIELNKRYSVYKGVRLSGMAGNKFFVSNTGSTAVKSTIVLCLCEPVSADEAFIVVSDSPDDAAHNGAVVFAYDPSGVSNDVLGGGNISFSGGSRMMYQSLTVPAEIPSGYYVNKNFESERGTTEFAINPSSLPNDPQYYEPRDIPSSGNVFRITRQVNIFSDIIMER